MLNDPVAHGQISLRALRALAQQAAAPAVIGDAHQISTPDMEWVGAGPSSDAGTFVNITSIASFWVLEFINNSFFLIDAGVQWIIQGGGTVVFNVTVNYAGPVNYTVGPVNYVGVTVVFVGSPVTFDSGSPVTFNGTLAICGAWDLCYSDVTLTQRINDNVALSPPKKPLYRIFSTYQGDITITSVNPVDLQAGVILYNATAYKIILENESLSAPAVAASKLHMPDGRNLVLRPADGAILWYNQPLGRQVCIASTTTTITPGDLNQFLSVGSDGTAQWLGAVIPEVGNFAVSLGSHMILYDCDATSGNITATLPDWATADDNFTVGFRKRDSTANTVTITAAGANTIDGAATDVLTLQYQIHWIEAAFNEWCVTSRNSSGGGADPIMGASGPGHSAGDVGDPGSVAGTTRYWREDATFAVPPGTAGGVGLGTAFQVLTTNSAAAATLWAGGKVAHSTLLVTDAWGLVDVTNTTGILPNSATFVNFLGFMTGNTGGVAPNMPLSPAGGGTLDGTLGTTNITAKTPVLVFCTAAGVWVSLRGLPPNQTANSVLSAFNSTSAPNWTAYYLAKAGSYNATDGDHLGMTDFTAAATYNLQPAGTVASGHRVEVRNSSSGTLTIAPAFGEQINDLGNNVTITLTAKNHSMVLMSTGTKWVTLSRGWGTTGATGTGGAGDTFQDGICTGFGAGGVWGTF